MSFRLYRCNSNIFGLRLFSMGLSKRDLRIFNQFRLRNVVAGLSTFHPCGRICGCNTCTAENIPQLIIQVVYAVITGGGGYVSVAAMVSSSLSICVAVLDYLSKRQLLESDVTITYFSVVVSSPEVANNQSKYMNKTDALRSEIAQMYGFSLLHS